MKARESRDFFTATSTSMIEAARRAGVTHHVVLSIVGIDKVPIGYYQGKVAQERHAPVTVRISAAADDQ